MFVSFCFCRKDCIKESNKDFKDYLIEPIPTLHHNFGF